MKINNYHIVENHTPKQSIRAAIHNPNYKEYIQDYTYKPILSTPQNNTIQNNFTESPKESSPGIPNNSISIPAIGLGYQKLNTGSLYDLENTQNKLNYSLIIENQETGDICQDGDSFIYGHSAPYSEYTSHLPGSWLFKNLKNLKAGSIIYGKSKAGIECKYKVYEIFRYQTDNYSIPNNLLYNIYHPGGSSKNTLVLQTCGRSEELIFVRAELIQPIIT